jgi:hypothetical protein
MNRRKRGVLIVEDQIATLSATIDRLDIDAIDLHVAHTLGEAEVFVQKLPMDLVIADLKVPRGDAKLSGDSGLTFLQALRDGLLEDLNRHTVVSLVTAWIHDVDASRILQDLGDHSYVVGKLRPVLEDLRLKCPERLSWLPHPEDELDGRLVRDILVLRPPMNEDGSYIASVSRWPHGESVRIRASDLPEHVQQELAFPGTAYLRVWATINRAASSARTLYPHNFAVYEGDANLEQEFDRGER